jgi:hypothetical protein
MTLVQEPSVGIRLSSFGLGGTNASYSFIASPSLGYDRMACLEGSQANGAVVVPSANDAGADVFVSQDKGNFTEELAGVLTQPFEFWFELHQGYGYSVPGAPGITLRDVVVGQASPQEFGTNMTRVSSVPVVWYAHPREGRFELRAFVRTSSGLYVYALPVFLTPGGGMVWVKSCSAAQNVDGSNLTLSAPVNANPASWAHSVYLLYRYQGIEEIASGNVSIGLAEVDALAAPWNHPLTNCTVAMAGNPAVHGSVVIKGTLFIAANITAFPLHISLMVSTPGGETSANISIASSFSVSSLPVEAGQVILLLRGGGTTSGSTEVELAGRGGTFTPGTEPSGSVYYLIPGVYNLTATRGGVSRSATVTVNVSGSSTLEFDMTPQSYSATPVLYVLTALVVVGAALNAWLWIPRPRRIQPGQSLKERILFRSLPFLRCSAHIGVS